jgi:non-specific protein-tyrosine kinase
VELTRYGQILRAHLVLVVASVAVCVGLSAVLAWTTTPVFVATTQLFVSTAGQGGEVEGSYEAELYAQQRARSYAAVISGEGLARVVARQIGLAGGPAGVQDAIRVGVPPDSVLINVTVRNRSPRLAKLIAESMAEQVPQFVDALEARAGGTRRTEVSVATPARLPTSPIAPRKPLYLAMGALIGLTLGVAGAVARSAIDRRVRTSADVLGTARAPLLGTVDEHTGGAGPAVLLRDPSGAAADDHRATAANLRALAEEHGLRSVLVSSARFGDGRSEVAANLAVALARRGRDVVVVDADLRSPRQAALLASPRATGLADVLAPGAGDLPLADRVSQALHRHPSVPVTVLAAGTLRLDASTPTAAEVGAVLDLLTERFDLVIVDAPPLLADAEVAALAKRVSAVVLVVRAGSTAAGDLARARRRLDVLGTRPLGIVLNGMGARERRRQVDEAMQGTPALR